jgi:hypothetical protein
LALLLFALLPPPLEDPPMVDGTVTLDCSVMMTVVMYLGTRLVSPFTITGCTVLSLVKQP